MTNPNLSVVTPMVDSTGEIRDRIIVSVAGEDEILPYDRFGLSFDSSESDILNAIRPLIQEKYSVDMQGAGGHWLYKTRKAITSRNIHVIPNSTAGAEHALSYLDDTARLKAFETITAGCQHLWSKNQIQEEKMAAALKDFSDLAEKDPLFLAHFTSYAFKRLDTKDLWVVATFLSSLSDADGTPFVAGGEYHKPNWRVIAQAAFCQLDPKLALRVLRLANTKRTVGSKPEATHFSKHLRTAARKYLRYREQNPKVLEGIKKAGLGKVYKSLYRMARIAPSPEATQILRWKQKPGFPGASVEIKKSTMFDFEGLTDLQIAEKIRKNKLKPQATLGALPDKISPVIAAAILEQCSGDTAVVLTSLFEDQGLLKNPEVKKLYEAKIKTAKQGLDRVERIKQQLDEDTKAVLRTVKADVRKEQVGDVGKLFLHIDISGSMQVAIEVAKNKGAIIAECVKNPEVNFHWGVFNNRGGLIQRPARFTKDAFMSSLYGLRAGGGTNCLALFEHACQLGCDTQIFVTDGGHTDGNVGMMLQGMKARGLRFPKQVVIVRCGTYDLTFENGLKAAGVPYSVIREEALTESALVTQALRTAIKGASAVIDEIMATPLMTPPQWWGVVS